MHRVVISRWDVLPGESRGADGGGGGGGGWDDWGSHSSGSSTADVMSAGGGGVQSSAQMNLSTMQPATSGAAAGGGGLGGLGGGRPPQAPQLALALMPLDGGRGVTIQRFSLDNDVGNIARLETPSAASRAVVRLTTEGPCHVLVLHACPVDDATFTVGSR